MAVNLRVPLKSRNFLTNGGTVSFSRRTAPWGKMLHGSGCTRSSDVIVTRVSQLIPCFHWTQRFVTAFKQYPPLDPVLYQMNSAYTSIPSLIKVRQAVWVLLLGTKTEGHSKGNMILYFPL
jgi:hypothetical protein